jgi:CheY-like chemotaxis protein
MKILIVDDNERVRRLIKLLVRDVCDEVVECADGESALTAYVEHVPDWVLMDIEMGKMDGLKSSLGIKDAYPEARILIVTNYDDNRLRQRAKEVGACGYVLKENLSVLREILISTA